MTTHSNLRAHRFIVTAEPDVGGSGASGPSPARDAGGGILSWLRSCIAGALLDYVCAQHPAHPDLLDYVKHDRASWPEGA